MGVWRKRENIPEVYVPPPRCKEASYSSISPASMVLLRALTLKLTAPGGWGLHSSVCFHDENSAPPKLQHDNHEMKTRTRYTRYVQAFRFLLRLLADVPVDVGVDVWVGGDNEISAHKSV